MNILNFLYKLYREGFVIWTENETIKYRQYKEIANLDEVVAQIRNYKNELVEILTLNHINKPFDPDSTFILKINGIRTGLSYSQERLRFIEKYTGGSNVYNIPLTYELNIATSWQRGALINSLRQIIARHEILRSLIKEDDDGNGYQEVQDLEIKPLVIIEKDIESTEVLKQEITTNVNHTYKLDLEYPIRIGIYNVKGVDRVYLNIVVHHIAFDGWSIEIFLRELGVFYRRYARNALGIEEIKELPELKIQYKDFALWQKSFFDQQRIAQELSYWKGKLNGYSHLNFPTDRPRPKELDYRGSKEFFEITASVSNNLKQLTKGLEVSLYSLLLAVYCLTLKVYTGQDDIVVGTPALNRHHHKSLMDLIGLFVNTLALRINVRSQQSITQYIKTVGKCIVEAQLHQDLPFEKLVEELVVEKDISRNPIFQTVFAVENFASSIAPNHDRLNEYRDLESMDSVILNYYTEDVYHISRFDLSMFIDDSGNKLKGHVEYATSLFDKSTIQRFIEVYTHILQQLSELARDQLYLERTKVVDVQCISAKEKQKIIYNWNETSINYTNDRMVPKLFEDLVSLRPDGIAIAHENKRLTYSELNTKVNQLSHYLYLNKAASPGDIVAILIEKSIDTIIAILAILKTGAAYVPIDPEYPQDRVSYILNDSNATTSLTTENYADRFHSFGGKVVLVDNLNYEIYDDSNPTHKIHPQSLAYIIYTSGSTGKPKGVLIEHHSLLNTLISVNAEYNVGSDDAVILLSNLTFDLSVYDILGLLIAGGKVVIPADSKDPHSWSTSIKQEQVTIWNTAPQLAALWGHHEQLFPHQNHFNKIRLFLLSGDVIPPNLPHSLKKLTVTNSAVICLGGATEASIWSIWHKSEGVGIIPYGRPMPNQQMYILDKNLNPTPIGVVGNIYIGGIGLATGYIGRSDFTAEKFMANPFSGGRIYCTGDVGKFLDDGNIIFLGRQDTQVKIRGYRVELGEIEALLISTTIVKDAIALIQGAPGGQKTLIAFVVLKNPSSKNDAINILRKKCHATLPEYMQPEDIIILGKFPITANGKIDRSKLLEEYKKVGIEPIMDETPHGDIEKTLAKIWCTLLNIGSVGRNANFFRLGGDSITSIQMVSRARKEGIAIEIKQVFITPTIADLAKYSRKVSQDVKPIEYDKFELLPIQKWFFDHNADLNHFNQAFWFVTEQDVDLQKLENAINDVRSYHESFRLKFNTENSQWTQHYGEEVYNVNLQIVNQVLDLDQLSSEIDKIHKSIDIIHGPIDRVVWFNGYGVLWIIHHLIVDMVSWHILLDDLNTVYCGGLLPSRENTYKDWSHYVYNYQNIDSIYEFYSKNTTKLLPNITSNTKGCACEIYTQLSHDITKHFIKDAHKCYNTLPNDLLLAALKLGVGDISGDYGVSIDIEGHGRERLEEDIDVSTTVGWFTSIYPLSLSVSAPENLASTILEIKKYLRQIPHNGISYGILVQHGKIQHQNSSIIFNYLGKLDGDTSDQVFTFGNYPIGNSVSEKNKMGYMIEINGAIRDNRLVFSLKHTTDLSHQMAHALLTRFEERFIEIIKHCIKLENHTYTTNDFDVVLEEDELSYIIDLMNQP